MGPGQCMLLGIAYPRHLQSTLFDDDHLKSQGHRPPANIHRPMKRTYLCDDPSVCMKRGEEQDREREERCMIALRSGDEGQWQLSLKQVHDPASDDWVLDDGIEELT
jgi:hypothetical protein